MTWHISHRSNSLAATAHSIGNRAGLVRVVGLAVSAVLIAQSSSASAADAMIQQGKLRGSDKGQVAEYLAIPFAQPPVGPLRWHDPEPATGWAGVRDATKPSAACMQGPPRGFGPFTSEFLIDGPVSEDCLYLNVWAPKHATGRLPVFFWIHGGGFGSGSGTIPIYNGTDLASKGAVVVTINYRVGVFGFLAHPALTTESATHTSGNYGVMDMIAALKWVRANVAAFGGDPNDITIAGQSAGAAAVNDLVLSPPAKGLFQRAIAQSGSGMGLLMADLPHAEANGEQFAASLGAATIADLRAMPADKIAKAADVPPPSPTDKAGAPRISFAPNRDNVVLVGDPGDPAAKPVIPVPFLTGANADEGALFGGDTMNVAGFEADVARRFGASADHFLALYPHATDAEAKQSFATISRDRALASLMFWSYARMKNSPQQVYTYMYDHPYPVAADGKSYAAFHTSEVPYVFGALGLGGRTFTDKDRAVSAQIQAHWLAFMKTGNPSTPPMPWPAATQQIAKVMGIGDTVGPRFGISSLERYQAFEAFVKSGGQLSLF